jgi:hypothetical protein
MNTTERALRHALSKYVGRPVTEEIKEQVVREVMAFADRCKPRVLMIEVDATPDEIRERFQNAKIDKS